MQHFTTQGSIILLYKDKFQFHENNTNWKFLIYWRAGVLGCRSEGVTVTDESVTEVTDESVTVTDESVTVTDKGVTVTDESVTEVTDESVTVTDKGVTKITDDSVTPQHSRTSVFGIVLI